MNEREQLITLALMTKTAAEPDSWWSSALKNPITQYTLGGMGVGGAASIIRNLIGKPDPGMEGSALARFLRAMTLGGLAGAGVSGGAKLMGYDLPTIDSAKEQEVQRPGLTQAAGVGLGVGATALLGLLAARKIKANKLLSARIGGSGGVLAAMKKMRKTMGPQDAARLDKIMRRVGDMPSSYATRGGFGRFPGMAQPVKVRLRTLAGRGPVTDQFGRWRIGTSPQWARAKELTAIGRPQALWGQLTGQSPQLIMLKRMIKNMKGTPAGEQAARFLHSMPAVGKKGKFKFDNDWVPTDLDSQVSPMLRSRTGGLWPWFSAPSVLGPAALATGGSMLFGEEG